MHEIQEQRSLKPTTFDCTCCEASITSNHFWSVDGTYVCDNCFSDAYGDLVKCCIADCDTYAEEDDFTDGMCESCLEVNTPLAPSDQEGWEHNIRRWSEE